MGRIDESTGEGTERMSLREVVWDDESEEDGEGGKVMMV